MQNLVAKNLQQKELPYSTEWSFALISPLRGLDGSAWRQKFLSELPEDTGELVAAVLKHKGGGQLLIHLSNRPGMANTAADIAYLLGVSEKVLQPLLEWLAERGILETICVEGTTFYRLAEDKEQRAHVHLFRERRDRWLAQMRSMTNWLEGTPPRFADLGLSFSYEEQSKAQPDMLS
jgi:hypothetical protein